VTSERELVVPSEIPWSSLTGQALEELLFWLCHDLGAQDVHWRTGAGGASADGSRDVEATFHEVADGVLNRRHWWLQAKGRSGTVEPMAVKETVITAAGDSEVDCVVVATNSGFSNPTRDWVRQFQRGHTRPDVLLWDRNDLERMLVDHPSVVVRVAPSALSPQGQVDAIVARFLHSVRLPGEHELRSVWAVRGDLELSMRARVALACAELSHGDPEGRAWLLEQDEGYLLMSCALALVDLPPLAFRAHEFGVDEGPLLELGTYVIEVALARLTPALTRALVANPYRFFEDAGDMEEAASLVREYFYDPAISRARRRLGAACAGDCTGMMADGLDAGSPNAFARLTGPRERDVDDDYLDIEKLDGTCAVGLELDEARTCPWFRDVALEEVVDELHHALAVRLEHPVERHGGPPGQRRS